MNVALSEVWGKGGEGGKAAGQVDAAVCQPVHGEAAGKGAVAFQP